MQDAVNRGTSSAALDPDQPSGAAALPKDAARLLRALTAHLNGMVYRRRNDARLTVEFVSEGCARLTGYPRNTLRDGRIRYSELIHAQDRAAVLHAGRQALSAKGNYAVEYRVRHADGTQRWVWERGAVVVDEEGGGLVLEGFIEDISARKDSERALEEAEKRYHSIFESALEGIFRTTPEGRYIVANPALALIYGYDSAADLISDVQNLASQTYVDPARRDEFRRQIEAEGSVSGFEFEARRKSGERIWISVNARVGRDDNGHVTHYEGTVEDVTERRRYQERIEQQANYDALTGLANRTLLNDRLTHAIAGAKRDKTRLAVAFIDLDQFKFINDTFGHQLGDGLLKSMAARLKACVRECDTVARQGGDEFVLLLPDCGTDEELTRVIKRVHAAVAEPWVSGRREFHVTCSIGVAVYPSHGRNADVLLRNADSAMYKAKESGRNTLTFFTAELNRAMVERLSVEHKLRGALARKQFLLHYQPRVDMHTRTIVGAEALLRWRVPKGGLFSPARFISVAEDTGLIVPIGTWALNAACQQNKTWQIQGLEPIVVSVNVSARQFVHGDIVRTIATALEDSGLEPRYLQLELTESLVMHDAEKYVSMLRAIKQLGVQIAVDDFGTGYSSLSYLKRFPVDHLKIDRSFVKDLASDPDDAAIVQAIIALGHKLGMKVIAEGVETEEQFNYLRDNQCDEMQGFYFCRPVIANEFSAVLCEHSVDLVDMAMTGQALHGPGSMPLNASAQLAYQPAL